MPKWFTVQAKADAPTEILIYDQIGEDYFGDKGIALKEFAAALKDIAPDKEIVVRFNSPGGNVWDGLAMYNLLAARREKVVSIVDGIAASIASVIALAGRELQMPANSILMIHDAHALAAGNADDLREFAERLDKHSDLIADIYAKKTGKTRQAMRDLMKQEPYMSGEEAKERGFADTVTESSKMAASLIGRVLNQIREPKPAIQSGDKTTDPKNMQKRLIAILATLGVKVADDATEDQLFAELQTALDKKPSAELMAKIASDLSAVVAAMPKRQEPPAKDDEKTVDLKEIRAKLEANEKRLEQERVKRVTREVEILAEQKCIDPKEWTPRAIADETVLDSLRKLPDYADSTPRKPSIQNFGNPLLETYNAMKPGKDREKFRIENHVELMETRHKFLQPRAANTIASALLPDYLADALVVVVWNRLSSLRAHSRDFGVNPMAPKATVQVRKATTGSAAQTNPTNFETGDSTLSNIAVTVNQINKSFQITNQERNSGHRLAHLAGINALLFADAISDVVTALMIAGNFGAATVIGAASAFSTSGLPAIFALAKNYLIRNLILDGDYIARLIPADKFKFDVNIGGPFSSFDGLFMNNKWTGGVANLVGFVCDPRAIAVASGLPESGPPGEFVSNGTFTLEDLGLTVQLNEWFSRAGRVNWASYDVMFGAAVGDGTAAENLVSA